jgi:hypothetical protein
MKYLLPFLLAAASLSAAQSKPQTFTGIITDEMCARVGHAPMRMGPTDAECTNLCVMLHDAAYVLESGKEVYVLSDQKTPEQFAGEKVTVVGTVNAKTHTIQVQSIAKAK